MADSPTPSFGLDELAWDGRALCGCWRSIHPPLQLDLADAPIHGTAAHADHGSTVHAWCAICSPDSPRAFELIRERQRRHPGITDDPFEEPWMLVGVDSIGRPVLGGTFIIGRTGRTRA